MKQQLIVWAGLGILAIALTSVTLRPQEPTNEPLALTNETAESSGFAVVELFTSQGCSSCPSADKALSGIIDQAREKGQRVYGLSFHVDYWNYLGWHDPYSDARFSQLQSRYASTLRSQNYTPQMVVNGKELFVGSNRERANQVIGNALSSKPANATINLNAALNATGKNVLVNYETTGTLKGQYLNIAVVERNISNEVPRGENRGRTLHHDNVVRTFWQKPLFETAGSTSLDLPPDLNLENTSVIAYLQDQKSYQINAVDAVDLAMK